MRKTIFLLLLTSLIVCASHGQGIFSSSGRGSLVGKNQDSESTIGYLVSNPAGIEKKSWYNGGKETSWTSRLGSVTFHAYSTDLPVGGMNENGLVVESIEFPGTIYPNAGGSTGLNEYEFIKYCLDNFSTTEEVVHFAKTVNIFPFLSKLHYYITDAKGQSAVIEFVSGERSVHYKETLPYHALSRRMYATCTEALKSGIWKKGSSCGDFDALVANSSANTPQEGFSALDKVKSPRTGWQIVYDVDNRKIHYKTKGYATAKEIGLKPALFAGGRKYIDLNNLTSGDITAKMAPLTITANTELMTNAFRLNNTPGISAEMIRPLASDNSEEINRVLKTREKTTGNLKVIIHNLSNNKGVMKIGLYDSEADFENQRSLFDNSFPVAGKSAVAVFYNLPLDKQYAISYYHDENDNNKIDRHWTGFPKENYGFSGRGSSFGKAAFSLDKKTTVIQIKHKGFLFF